MKFFQTILILPALILLSLFSLSSSAADLTPECLSNGRPLRINNEDVLKWKQSTPNQFRERSHVDGTLIQKFAGNSSHHHIEIQIGPHPTDLLEVVYNDAFGRLPALHPGSHIEACGDYITSHEPSSGPYPASPDGAIIHWVHANPRKRGHESGFLKIDDTVYGVRRGRGLRRDLRDLVRPHYGYF